LPVVAARSASAGVSRSACAGVGTRQRAGARLSVRRDVVVRGATHQRW
jgi:hypothetical protein